MWDLGYWILGDTWSFHNRVRIHVIGLVCWVPTEKVDFEM